MLRLLAISLLAGSGVLAQNETTTAAPSGNGTVTATAAASTGNGTVTTTAAASAAVTTTAAASAAVSTAAPANDSKVASGSAAISSVGAEVAMDFDVTIVGTDCAGGVAAEVQVWCTAGNNAMSTEAKKAFDNTFTSGTCDKDGKLVKGDYCVQSKKCAITGLDNKYGCHVHNPNVGDRFDCGSSVDCAAVQTTLDTANSVYSTRRRLTGTEAKIGSGLAVMVAKTKKATAAALTTDVKARIDAKTASEFQTLIKSEATTYVASTDFTSNLPTGNTAATSALTTNIGNSNVTARAPTTAAAGGSTAGATSAVLSVAAVAAALLF